MMVSIHAGTVRATYSPGPRVLPDDRATKFHGDASFLDPDLHSL